MNKPKVLLLDIETSPILAHVWSIWEQNVGLNQIARDWCVLSWSAKWLDEPPTKIMYQDQRNVKNFEDDRGILKSIWKLLDEADIIITQNGKSFDQKKLNARFILNGMRPPSSFRHIDTFRIAKRHFAFTSNKLEYMSDKLCTKYKKLKHSKFAGFEMWKECMKGNRAAWKEMEIYNKHDVLALEELYNKLVVWDSSINFGVYSDLNECTCGKTSYSKNGFFYTNSGKFQRFVCKNCGKETHSKENLLSKAKKKSLKRGD